MADAAAFAVIEEQPAIRVLVADVAAAQPAAFRLGFRRLFVAEIVDLRGFAGGGPADQLAADARRTFVAGVVDDLDFEIGRRLAETADRSGAQRTIGHAALDGAIGLENPYRETLLEILPDGGGHAGAEDELDGVVRVVRLHRFAVDGSRHAAEEIEEGAVVFARDVPEAGLGELAAEHDALAQTQRGGQRHQLRIAVGEGKSGIGPRVVGDPEHGRAERGGAIARIREDDAFRIAGRPRGVDDFERIVGPAQSRIDENLGPCEDLRKVVRTGHIARMQGAGVFAGFQHPDPVEARYRAADLRHLRERIVGADDAAAAGIVECVGKLGAARAGIDRHEDDTQQRRRDHQLDEFGMIAQQDGKAVAVAHAARDQACRESVGVAPQRGIGANFLASAFARLERDHVEIGAFLRSRRDQIRQDEFVRRAHGAPRPQPGW